MNAFLLEQNEDDRDRNETMEASEITNNSSFFIESEENRSIQEQDKNGTISDYTAFVGKPGTVKKSILKILQEALFLKVYPSPYHD